jgi:TPR repeat protein
VSGVIFCQRTFALQALLLSICILGPSLTVAADCADLAPESDIYLFFGCKSKLDADVISENFETLTDSGKLFARWAYLIEGEKHPSQQEIKNFTAEISKKSASEMSASDLLFAQAIRYLDPRIEPHITNLDFSQEISSSSAVEVAALSFAFSTGRTDFLNMRLIDVLARARESNIPRLRRDYIWQEITENSSNTFENEFIADLKNYSERLPLAADDIGDYYAQFDKKEKALRSYAAASSSGFIIAMESYAETLIMDRSEKKFQRERQGVQLLEEMAFYGSEYSQDYLGLAYLNGWGVTENENRGVMWRERAASNGDSDAQEFLVDRAVDSGRYNVGLKWSLALAQSGHVSIDSRGYKFASLLMKAVFSQDRLNRALEYLRWHCTQNYHIENPEKDCRVGISQSDRKFENLVDLATFDGNFSTLTYANSIDVDPGKYNALIIANEAYEKWDPLQTPTSDAQALGKLLKEKFDFDVTYLFNANRRETLKAIYDIADELRFEDHLLVYYAGHGVVDRSTDTAYWIPPGASRNFQPDWISADEIMTSLKSVPARHLLLVADSCYSGKLLRSNAQVEENVSNATVERLFQKKARIAITSGGNEPVQDSSSGGKHSVFAHALLGALDDVNGISPATNIFSDVLGKVSLESSQTPQYADMRELGHDGGDFIFIPDN